jgi:hypothetical protein
MVHYLHNTDYTIYLLPDLALLTQRAGVFAAAQARYH